MGIYISADQIRKSIKALNRFHIFFGTSFLVLKNMEAPVGAMATISLDAENRNHLKKYFRLHPESDHFFTPFQIKASESRWRRPKYASTSLQAVNTQSFAGALEHTKNENAWGWSKDYIDFLSSKLPKKEKLPLIDFAVWFTREEEFDNDTTVNDVLHRFISKFNLSKPDLQYLFSTPPSKNLSQDEFFSSEIASWEDVIEGYGLPDDVQPRGGAILQYLEFTNLGPSKKMTLEPASRLNIITGDNGLGKTFVLDIAWWALTQEWADLPIAPLEPVATRPSISFSVSDRHSKEPIQAEFNPKTYRWSLPRRSTLSGLVLYARVDGSFAVWDPANPMLGNGFGEASSSAKFTRDSLWTGNNTTTEGLLRDWVRWQTLPDNASTFETFSKVIRRLCPPDWERFSIGTPQRVRGWPMQIPTLIHPYGTVPVIYESAGIRRILTLTYLIVWAWENHKTQAKTFGRKTERQMIILLDEAEAHLHPRWQRVLLRALLGIAADLDEQLSIQYFIASHSPLLLASAEPIWNTQKDKLFHLHMNKLGRVSVEELDFVIHGSVDSWLNSPSFDSLHPGSKEAETALERAKKLFTKNNPTKEEIENITEQLSDHIAADDPFWMRWIIFSMQHGVEL